MHGSGFAFPMVLVLFVVSMMSGCSRHNDTNIPGELTGPVNTTPDCQYTQFENQIVLIENMQFTKIGALTDVASNPGDSTRRFSANVSYLTKSVDLSLNTYNAANGFEVLPEQVLDSGQRIPAQRASHSDLLTAKRIFLNGEQIISTSDDFFATVQLSEGTNRIEVRAIAEVINYMLPFAGTGSEVEALNKACGYPTQQRMLRAVNANASVLDLIPVKKDRVNLRQDYVIEVSRRNGNSFEAEVSELAQFGNAGFTIEDNEKFGSVMVLGRVVDNDTDPQIPEREVLVIGVPDEDSSASGVHPVVDGILPLATQDNAAPDSGAVFIYERDENGAWALSDYIKAPFVRAGDRFGSALAMDGNILAVSAPFEDSAYAGASLPYSHPDYPITPQSNRLAPDSGAVYIYIRRQGAWILHQTLKPEDILVGNDGYFDNFGYRLALVGGTLVVSAPNDDSNDGSTSSGGPNTGAPNSGRAVIYEWQPIVVHNESATSTPGFSFRIRLKAPNIGTDDRFGSSIHLTPDGLRLLVGAPEEDSDFRGIVLNRQTNPITPISPEFNDRRSNSGAVYEYNKLSGNWVLNAYIKAPNSDAGDRFGAALASLYEGKQLLIGAPFEDGNGTNFNRNPENNSMSDAGAVYLYEWELPPNSTQFQYSYRHYMKSDKPQIGARFGAGLAASSNFFVVTAPSERESLGSFFAGHVRLYAHSQLALPSLAKKLAPPIDSPSFGLSAVLSDATLVIADPAVGVSGVSRGKVLTYH